MLDEILNKVFHKAQFWVHYFLILMWLTYFMNAKKMILQIMLTPQVPIFVVLTHSHCHFWIIKGWIATKVFNWFVNNHIKASSGKCHLLLNTKSLDVGSIDGMQITSSNDRMQITSGTAETLLGITNDSAKFWKWSICHI